MAAAKAQATAHAPIAQFGRERRLHARAYDHWVSLLRGRRMPLASDMRPDDLKEFSDRSVLIDLPVIGGTPVIAHLGHELRDEAGVMAFRPAIEEVPSNTLLHALLKRLSEIVAHQAPVGFEAEFEGRSGGRMLHRGIMLPFADESGALASVYGVINWKELAAAEKAPDIAAAVGSIATARTPAAAACAWGDGPSATLISEALPPQPIDQQLATARTWAALAEADGARGDSSLHAALNAAYDYLLAARTAGPITTRTVVRQVFGDDLNRLCRMRFTATLDHALRLGLGTGRVANWLDGLDGGHIAAARAERAARSAAKHDYDLADLLNWADRQQPIGQLDLQPAGGDIQLFLGRRRGSAIDIVASVPEDARFTRAAIARARRR